jgi:hypothetical protein
LGGIESPFRVQILKVARYGLTLLFLGWFCVFLLGVLVKTGGRTWFFDGEFVVD